MKINNIEVRVSYRVQNGGRLHVTHDGRIWYGSADAKRFSHVADVGERGTAGTGKDAICRAANCW